MKPYIKVVTVVALTTVFTSHVQANNEREKGEHQRPTFTSIDLNEDGIINSDEFSSHKIPHGDHDTIFASIDSNEDGIISQEEFENHKPPRPRNNEKKGNRDD